MYPEEQLNSRITLRDIHSLVDWTLQGDNLSKLLTLIESDNRRVSVNAVWVMTNLQKLYPDRLSIHRDFFINALLTEVETAKKRMLLQILRHQDFSESDFPSDLFDYCLSKINSEKEPYAVRCFSLYTALNICKTFKALIGELNAHVELLELQSLSPGLKSALRQTKSQIKRISGKCHFKRKL